MTSGTPVYLHVYDLYSQTINNTQYVVSGKSLFHASVEVYGQEYNYVKGKGILKVQPGKTDWYAAHREPIPQGFTRLSEEEVLEMIANMDKHWQGGDYNLLSKNCCTFARVFLESLSADPLPGWVDRAARRGFESAASTAVQAVGTSGVQLLVAQAAGPASWAAFGGELLGGHVGGLVGENVSGDFGKQIGENVGGVGGAVGAGATVGVFFAGPIGALIGAGVGIVTFALGKGADLIVNKVDINRQVTNIGASALKFYAIQECRLFESVNDVF